jgi:hypothetical protein
MRKKVKRREKVSNLGNVQSMRKMDARTLWKGRVATLDLN